MDPQSPQIQPPIYADDVIKDEVAHLISPAFAERALLERGYLSPQPRIAHGRA